MFGFAQFQVEDLTLGLFHWTRYLCMGSLPSRVSTTALILVSSAILLESALKPLVHGPDNAVEQY